MNRFLSVVLLSILMVSGAYAYPGDERAGDACPVVGSAEPHSVLQRMSTEPQSQYPMSPVASCGQAAPSTPALLAQQYWGVCRYGAQYCYLVHPHFQGQRCCCYDSNGVAWMCGTAQPF